jgi:hypothetical protein
MYFCYFWYVTIGYLVYLYIINYQNLEINIIYDFYFKYFWNLPFYFLSEILYWVLIYIDNRKKKELTDYQKENSKKYVNVVIAAHNAEETLKSNLSNITSKFSDYKVWVADNDSYLEENTSLKSFCEENSANYVHYNIPNKTNAIFETVKKIKSEDPSVKYIMLLDDDTILCDNFYIREDLLNEPAVAGYCCCIGINKDKKFNIFEHWVDFEYRTLSFRNRAKNLYTQRFLNGIVCVYKIDALIDIFKWNYCLPGGLPFGEDAYAGLQARMIGYKLKQDNLNYVLSYCPKKLFNFSAQRSQGYGASSLFKQRALRWYLSWSRRMLNEVGLFLSYDTGSWVGNILYRIDSIWYVYLLLVSIHWINIVFRTFYIKNTIDLFLILHGLLFGITTTLGYIRNYVIMNKIESKDVRWFVPLTYPIFLVITLYLYCAGFIISLLYFIPFYRINYNKIFKNI